MTAPTSAEKLAPMGYQRVLAISAHTDDVELGCGGTISRLLEEGSEVRAMAFSRADTLLSGEFQPDEPEREMLAAMAHIGMKKENVLVRDFPVRHFSEHRQAILQELWEMNEAFKPDLVLMHRPRDLHQDHMVIAQEGMRAFKKTTILCYELPWNTVQVDTEAFVVLEDRHMEAKLGALAFYRTQSFREFLDEEFIRGWARTRGVQVGRRWAECFEVPRLIL